MKTEFLFLQLFAAFVRQTELTKEVHLTEDEWKELYRLSELHQIVPIIYESVMKHPYLKQEVPAELNSIWKRKAMMMVVGQTRITSLFLELYGQMKEEGLQPLIMKGLVCRNLYHKPDCRLSGDEDLLLPKEEFRKMDRFLLERGFEKTETDEELEAQMDTLHEVGYRNRKNGLYLEIHLSMFPEISGAYGHYNEMFGNPFDSYVEVSGDDSGMNVYTLGYTEHFLYLLCHSAKHFLHSGFGVRQLMDMILFAEAYGKEINWNYIIKETKKHQLYVFLANLFDIGKKHFGFDPVLAAYPEELKDLDSELLLVDLLAGGVFGASTAERLHSANITLAAANREEKVDGLLASLFPKRSYIETRYEYVKNHPWLLPVGWIHRILDFLKKGEQIDNKKVLEVGNERVAILRKYGMTGKGNEK